MRRVDAVALAERLRTEESLLDYSELPTLPGTMAGHSTSTRREDPSHTHTHTHTQVNTETHPRRKTQKHTKIASSGLDSCLNTLLHRPTRNTPNTTNYFRRSCLKCQYFLYARPPSRSFANQLRSLEYRPP